MEVLCEFFEVGRLLFRAQMGGNAVKKQVFMQNRPFPASALGGVSVMVFF